MEGDSNIWWKDVGNEHGRLANEINNIVRSTNKIYFIRKGELIKGHTFTYANYVCDYLPLKSEL